MHEWEIDAPRSAADYLLSRLEAKDATAYAERCASGESVRGVDFWRAVVLAMPGPTRQRLRASIAAHPGWQKADHARLLGVSHQRIGQLWPAAPTPEGTNG